MTLKREMVGQFELNSIFLLVCTVFSGTIGYLYQIVLGNILSVESYGQANVLITYISTMSMITQPMALLVSRNIPIYNVEKREHELNNFLAVIYEITVLICFFLCVIVFGFEFIREGIEGNFLNTLWFCLTLVSNIIYTILLYVVQGHKQFVKFGVVSLAYALVKVAVVLVIRHMQSSYIVMISMTVSDIICIILLLCPNKRGSIIRRYRRQNIAKWLPEIMPFYGLIFVVQILLGFIINGGDVILIKHLFSDTLSGIYAVCSNLCRIAIIGTTPILSIMYTEVASCLKDKKALESLLKKALLYCSVIAGAYFLVLNIAGEWIITFLYGSRYNSAMSFLLATSFFIMGAVWLHILSQYCIALGKIKMIAVILIFIIIGVFMSAMFIAEIDQTLIALGTIICLGDAYCYYKIKKDIKEWDKKGEYDETTLQNL